MVLAAVVLVVMLFGIAVVGMAQVVALRVAATTAADAAALGAAPVTFRPYGAAGSPASEASRLAAANGARLVSCRCPVDRSFEPRTIVVVVEIEKAVLVLGSVTMRATARAEFSPPRLLDPIG